MWEKGDDGWRGMAILAKIQKTTGRLAALLALVFFSVCSRNGVFYILVSFFPNID